MASIPLPPPAPGGGPLAGPMLSQALKALRRRRGLRAAEVAEAMGMPLRSYEHFESGQGRLNLDRIAEFAEATDTDGFAIFAAVAMGSPQFALRCADNKLMTILLMTLQDFDAAAGDQIAGLDARTLIAAFAETVTRLEAEARARTAGVEAWMSRRGECAAAAGRPAETEEAE